MSKDDRKHKTYRLSLTTDLLNLERGRFGSQPEPGLIGYVKLPLDAAKESAATPSWRVVLELTGANQGRLAFEILDDVTVGRDHRGSDSPDVDLTILQAEALGVSRQHALLRPTESNLYVLDLYSTNGTMINGIKLGAGRIHALKEGDHLSLGKLNMSIARLERIDASDADGDPEESEPS